MEGKNTNRQARLEVRLSEREKKYIQHKADLANKSISDYIRSVGITGIVINTDTRKIGDMLYELNRIGNNINQITKAVHTHGDYVSPKDIKAIREEFEAMKNLIFENIINAAYEYEAKLNEVKDKLVDVYVSDEDMYDEEEALSYLDEMANDLAEFGIEFQNHDDEEKRLLNSSDDFEKMLREEFGE